MSSSKKRRMSSSRNKSRFTTTRAETKVDLPPPEKKQESICLCRDKSRFTTTRAETKVDLPPPKSSSTIEFFSDYDIKTSDSDSESSDSPPPPPKTKQITESSDSDSESDSESSDSPPPPKTKQITESDLPPPEKKQITESGRGKRRRKRLPPISKELLAQYCESVHRTAGFDVIPLPPHRVMGNIVPLFTGPDHKRALKKDKYIRGCIRAAIKEYYTRFQKKLKLVKVVKAMWQAATGLRYYITFDAKDADGITNTYQTAAVLFLRNFEVECFRLKPQEDGQASSNDWFWKDYHICQG